MHGDDGFFGPEHEAFRAAVRQFIDREVTPHLDDWDERRAIDRGTWLAAGKQGLLGLAVPEHLGGGGTADYRFRSVLCEELALTGAASLNSSFSLQDDVAIPYLLRLGTDEQRRRWLPSMCAGELIGAIAMTEPSAGSDLQAVQATARPDGGDWILNGAKTFITNGIQADLVIVVARTGGRGTPARLHSASSSSNGARPASSAAVSCARSACTRKTPPNCLHGRARARGERARRPAARLRLPDGNLPLERLSIAVTSLGAAQAALTWTVDYVKQRRAFGKPLAAQQNTQFAVAEMATEIDVTRAYVRRRSARTPTAR